MIVFRGSELTGRNKQRLWLSPLTSWRFPLLFKQTCTFRQTNIATLINGTSTVVSKFHVFSPGSRPERAFCVTGDLLRQAGVRAWDRGAAHGNGGGVRYRRRRWEREEERPDPCEPDKPVESLEPLPPLRLGSSLFSHREEMEKQQPQESLPLRT